MVDPHTIMDPRSSPSSPRDEKNALRRRMRTALRKVREELSERTVECAGEGTGGGEATGCDAAAANASRRRGDAAAHANVRAKGEEKRKRSQTMPKS